MPADWRFEGDDLKQTLMILEPQGHLLVLPPEGAERLRQQAAATPFTDRQSWDFWTNLFAKGLYFGLDAQRRVTIPQHLKDMAKLERECVLVGSGPVYRIYPADKWDEFQARTSGDAWNEAARAARF